MANETTAKAASEARAIRNLQSHRQGIALVLSLAERKNPFPGSLEWERMEEVRRELTKFDAAHPGLPELDVRTVFALT